MPRPKSPEEKKSVVESVKRMRLNGMSLIDACHKTGIHFATYYDYKRELNGGKTKFLRMVDGPLKPVMGLQFSVVGADEARTWVAGRGVASRFSELREGIVTQLAGLRKSEALSFPCPDPEDKKERLKIQTACNNAIKGAGLPWKVRWSFTKKLFIAIHLDKLGKKEEESNA